MALTLAFPRLPWHAFDYHQQPVYPLQSWIIFGVLELLGLSLIVSGVRVRREARQRGAR